MLLRVRVAPPSHTHTHTHTHTCIQTHTYTAQMDMSKSPGYRAVEELLKAQSTHMKLRRQFEEERLRKDLTEMKEVASQHLGCVCVPACVHVCVLCDMRPCTCVRAWVRVCVRALLVS